MRDTPVRAKLLLQSCPSSRLGTVLQVQQVKWYMGLA